MALPAKTSQADDSLQKVRRGEMSLDEYLDERAELALAHVKGKVTEARLQMLRETVREHMRTDPVVVEMVRRLTGLEPEPFSDELKN
jgi:hypothetical protein